MRYLIWAGFFVGGCVVGYFSEDYLRRFTRWCYEWTTNGGIHFGGGKEFYLPSLTIILVFGLALVIAWIRLKGRPALSIAVMLLSFFVTFFLVFIFYGTLDGYRLLTECTACDDGRKLIKWSELSYDFITTLAVFLGCVSLIVVSKNYLVNGE